MSIPSIIAPPDLNTFKTEFHPNAHCEPVIECFSAFGCVETDNMRPHIDDEAPWTPFKSRADFEFAEIVHQATLDKDQTDRLLKLLWRIVDGNTNFTLKSHADLSKAWDLAASQMTPFEKHIIPIKHKKDTLEFDMHAWPLWNWAMDLLSEPLLAPHFVWDVKHLYKHDRISYKHFIHEPWTADHWWHIQSSLPNNGVPFAIILYADKTHLSSSGAVKGYPVIAHCVNLPVPEDSGEDGKLSYTNLKHIVWHESFFKLLKSIILYAKTGFAHECYDRITHWLYPLILLLSADYKEQKDALKEHGLRPVKNVFWSVPNLDPHEIISQDSLHLWHMGLFGRHKFEDLKKCVGDLGHEALKKVDNQFSTFPQWRNLNHFDSNLYASQNILTCNEDKAGYVLLRCIASYLELNMYISLDVHTTDTIAAGEAELLVYQKLLEVMSSDLLQCDERTKNWNFPKAHGGKHIFHNVLEKGISSLLKLDHISLVSELICSHISHLIEEYLRCIASERELKSDEDESKDDWTFIGHICLGSPQSLVSFASVEEAHNSNHAFAHFQKKFTRFLNSFLPSNNIPLPNGSTWLRPAAEDTVHERRDCALIHTHDKDGNDQNIFVQLLFMFKYVVSKQTLDLALVQPMGSCLGTRCAYTIGFPEVLDLKCL
ncbi:hypothetical protein CY34DRAFT_21850 [Suillus luteus UH-Slu-Lm8-n1]|uniref:Uncharacterized protein n=1 Tax=Suillus luteus UH-Slu-Lm8-n1 TaxID=930992 RepID=A0A0D0BA77_9AGAM|nr:hypothetical protein CY34DRAFT_21850 [Suillus luteus UH-Slu-Lm8-n1]